MNKTIVIDIDGVIFEEAPTFDKIFSKPVDGAIESINDLYDQGYLIILFSARNWQMFKQTEYSLLQYKVKYHSLVLGKPAGDYYIDDRSFKSIEELTNKLKTGKNNG